MIQVKDKQFVPFIKESELLQRVSELGRQITDDYKGSSPLLIGVMNGAFMFLSDLSKTIDLPVELSFVKISSYESMSSTGTIKPLIGLETSLANRDVIIVEDIVDTGLSMSYVLEMLQKSQPRSLEIVTLLLKPEALKKDIQPKYVGFEIPTKFVVGYGLDYDGFGRNLREIYQLA
ncbi:MAG TPA: hypoxanthine phosphoribosyltransferase [Cyclobacteriaceae bacterium]|nr:hypoxanthine phosphoribosyltransferase [Cyclobacteriaceae bacterium]